MSRSVKKGPYVDERLIKKVEKFKDLKNNKELIKTYSRSCTVIPDFIGATICVHDGRKHVAVYITEAMVGHKLGEFAPTRTFRMHSGQRQSGKSKTVATGAKK